MPRILLLALACSIPCLAQNPSVEGRVTNEAGEPLRNARVVLILNASSGRNILFDTGPDGAFAMHDFQPGRYRLWAERAGYLRFEYPATLTLFTGQQLTGITLKLTRAALIAGKVVDQDGDPFPTARVTILDQKMNRVGQTDTNVRADGSFVVGDLPAGRYYLYAADATPPRPGDREVSGPREGYTVTYYPGVADSARATAVEVKTGAEVRNLEIRPVKARVSSIRGHVVDAASEAPVGSVQVHLGGKPSSRFRVSTGAAPDGSFEFSHIFPGDYALFLIPPPLGSNLMTMFGHQLVTLGSDDLDGVVIRVGPGVDIPGKVAMEGNGKARVRLDPLPGEGWWMNDGIADTKSDGSFVLSMIEPAVYRVAVPQRPAGTYVKFVRWGDQDVTGGSIDLTKRTQGKSLDIVLSPHAAELRGVVVDASGANVPGASVTLRHPGGATTNQIASQTGMFVFRSLAPGVYKIAAFMGERPENFTANFDARAAAVILTEDARVDVGPPLIR